MADALEGMDLSVLHQKIVEAFAEKFSTDFNLIAFYRDEEERRAPKVTELPALLLELTELEPDAENDANCEQLPVIARFEARIVVNAMQDKALSIETAKIKVRALAAKLAHYLYKHKRFHKLPAGALSVDAIVEDAFYPELDRYEVWRVDFSIPILIGESVWISDGITPTPAYSWSPNIGAEHEQDYQDIEP